MLHISGKGLASDCLNAVARQLNRPKWKLSEPQSRDVVRIATMGLFNKSDPMSMSKEERSKGEPLGLLAERLVMALTDTDNEKLTMWGCENISAVPFLNVYGQVSEMYITLKKSANKHISKTPFWPLFLRTVGLPLSDRAFVERQKNRLARGASSIAFTLAKEADQIQKLNETLNMKDETTKRVTSMFFAMGMNAIKPKPK